MAPKAAQRTAFKKDGRSDARAIVNTKALNVKDCSLLHVGTSILLMHYSSSKHPFPAGCKSCSDGFPAATTSCSHKQKEAKSGMLITCLKYDASKLAHQRDSKFGQR